MLAISRVSIITIAFYTLYVIFSAFTSANSLQMWQFAFAGVASALYLGGFLYIRQTDSPLSFAPLLGFLILAPLIVDKSAQNPWISNGLTCILMAVYMTGTGNKQVSYLSAGFIAVTEYVLAKAHLPSISDLSDIQYFGSYFSSLWILIVTVAMVRMRVNYLSMCDAMDVELDDLRTRMFYRRQFLKRMNLRDFLNLQLHGTVLNSLLVLRNRADETGLEPDELRRIVGGDLASINKDASIENSSILQMIADHFPQLVIGNVRLSIGDFPSDQFSQFLRLQIVELIREIAINADRHAGATSVRIELFSPRAGAFELRVMENSVRNLPANQHTSAAHAAMESKSVARLARGIAATYQVATSTDQSELIHSLSFSTDLVESDPVSELKRLRYAAVEVLTNYFLAISTIYGLSILPGLFIKGAPTAERIIFAMCVCSAAWSLYGRGLEVATRWLATISALSILPLLEFRTISCGTIPALAWMFNGMLAPIFLVSTKTKKAVLRWLPGIAFLVESLLTTINFPRSCNTILAGSTPGIIFILITAFLIGRIRNRNLEADARLSRQTDLEETNVEATEKLVSIARQELVDELESFLQAFSIPRTQKELQVKALNLEIQKIRAFLLCSEFFEYEPARELYRWTSDRISKGQETKINLMGEGKFDISTDSWLAQLAEIGDASKNRSVEILVLNTDGVSIQAN
jgi:hypothetical protein